jgi:hypothetical protein
MVACLKLTSQCAHWIEVTRNGETDKADFHKIVKRSNDFSKC